MKRKCDGCGREFEPISNRQKYCTPQCAKEHRKVIKKCVICGREIQNKNARKYCSTKCAYKAQMPSAGEKGVQYAVTYKDEGYVNLAQLILRGIAKSYVRVLNRVCVTEADEMRRLDELTYWENVIRSQYCQNLAMGAYEPEEVIRALRRAKIDDN